MHACLHTCSDTQTCMHAHIHTAMFTPTINVCSNVKMDMFANRHKFTLLERNIFRHVLYIKKKNSPEWRYYEYGHLT